jgi:outer membrane receptor protein involved in Fe transport
MHEIATAKTRHNEWSPAIFASFKPFRKEDFHVRAFYKKTFRMPTFNDLYYTIIGKSFLKPEFATQYNAGVTFGKGFDHPVFRNVTFQADAYHNTITDKIIATPTGNRFRWEMTNLGIVKILGADVALHAMSRINSLFLKTSLNYTYQNAADRTDPTHTNYGHQIPYTPQHSGSVIVNAEYKSWGLNYSFIYSGERYSNQENIRLNYVQPWYTSDMSVFREWQPLPRPLSTCALHEVRGKGEGRAGVRLKISAEVNNLLNQHYAVIENFPMPGRNYKLVFTVDF